MKVIFKRRSMSVSRDINMTTKMSRSHVDFLIYARNLIQFNLFNSYLSDLAVKSTCFDCQNKKKLKSI